MSIELSHKDILWIIKELQKREHEFKDARFAFTVSNNCQSNYAYQLAMHIANSKMNIKCRIHISLFDSFNWLYNSKSQRHIAERLN